MTCYYTFRSNLFLYSCLLLYNFCVSYSFSWINKQISYNLNCVLANLLSSNVLDYLFLYFRDLWELRAEFTRLSSTFLSLNVLPALSSTHSPPPPSHTSEPMTLVELDHDVEKLTSRSLYVMCWFMTKLVCINLEVIWYLLLTETNWFLVTLQKLFSSGVLIQNWITVWLLIEIYCWFRSCWFESWPECISTLTVIHCFQDWWVDSCYKVSGSGETEAREGNEEQQQKRGRRARAAAREIQRNGEKNRINYTSHQKTGELASVTSWFIIILTDVLLIH